MSEEQNQPDIYYKLGAIHGDIKRVDEKTDNILTQTTKTNGRVTQLENITIPSIREEINEIKVKIAYYTGGFAVFIWILEKAISKFAK